MRPETRWPGRTSTTTRDTKKRIDEGQNSLLTRNLKTRNGIWTRRSFAPTRHVYLLGKDNKLRAIDLGQITSSSAGSIVELILRELQAVRGNHRTASARQS